MECAELVILRCPAMKPSITEIAEARRVIPTDARRVREAARVSRRDVGRALGKAHTTISRWESGEAVPGAVDAVRYLRILRQLEKRAES